MYTTQSAKPLALMMLSTSDSSTVYAAISLIRCRASSAVSDWAVSDWLTMVRVDTAASRASDRLRRTESKYSLTAVCSADSSGADTV